MRFVADVHPTIFVCLILSACLGFELKKERNKTQHQKVTTRLVHPLKLRVGFGYDLVLVDSGIFYAHAES